MVKLNQKYLDRYITPSELDALVATEAQAAYRKLVDGTGADAADFTGWLKPREAMGEAQLKQIKAAAHEIQQNYDCLVVVGIGGSYLGARAVIELLQPADSQLEVVFAGFDLSSAHLTRLLDTLKHKNWAINVISKSGTTTEPAVALRILRHQLSQQFGDTADQRIFATTDSSKGKLHDLASQRGWKRFVVPDNIGGRYSVLTAVGLLPIAAAGIDIDQLLQGADDQSKSNSVTVKYAMIRNILYRKGFSVELLCNFSRMIYLAEWWKQLFAETEGKDNRGLWPASAVYSTDLHSLGQFVQAGRRLLFETFIEIERETEFVKIPPSDDDDGVGYLVGKTLADINRAACSATIQAHHDAAYGGVPIVLLTLPEVSAYQVGRLIYFMMMSCAVSAYILNPDGSPFDQPGVEFYKKNMFRLLGKNN
jgi:glucose-6-phosphate isomerase